ncbi:BAG family molecular chaperone regulator 8, chloroplastic [Amaranthus tricolor]|uniref:BAG family molecular chaperone regulator 8, chloroplastic n=1 Tax=Amaranthus tricolor TaxID=29722 RepID=UPI002590D6AD|nr:BAG family molecular chaperone regulator 8, chloroplastic [Amaranthus tricolor]
MAFHHQHNHQQNLHTTTTSICCCRTRPCYPPPPPSPPLSTPSTDPFLVAAIVSQLLQSPNPQNLYSQHIQTNSINHNQRHPHQDQTHQFHPHSPFYSLLQRIDALESSLQAFSSSGSSSRFSLRDSAARIIQYHFRAFLVHRSRTLRQLKDLASIKSALASLKTSLSRHGFVDFDLLSHKAMSLLLKLDSIQSGDKMIKDSKRCITREITEFLELFDGVYVKRHQVLTRKMKNLRLVENDNRAFNGTRGFTERNAGAKSRNLSNEEKKLMANLRERVEKIGRMSKALEVKEQEVFGGNETKGIKDVDDEENNIIDKITNNYKSKNGLNMKNAQSSNSKQHVCFVENGNLIRVYDVDRDPKARVVDVIEDSTKGALDEEEVLSDGEGSSYDDSNEGTRNCGSDKEFDNQDEEFTFSTTPEPLRIDPRADFMSRKSGVNIVES